MADSVVDEAKQLEKLKQKLNTIRTTNAVVVNEIESYGHQMDLVMPRLEHFMVFLVNLGVLTEKQVLEEAYLWERNLKEQLVPVVRAMREQVRTMVKEARKKQAASPPAPSQKAGPALVFPPGTRFDPVEEGSKLEEAQPTREATN